MPSAGSVFVNPDGDSAGRLIEASGLKGTRIGGAEVSEVHANFIINVGGATAADVVTLVRLIRDTVKEAHGIELTPEVRFLGQFNGS
jgi:UDP-N-acetylmuramate dehydrogenase